MSPVYRSRGPGDDSIGRLLGNPALVRHIRQLAKEEAQQVRFGSRAREVFEPRSIPQRAVEARVVDHLPRQAEEQEEILLAPGDGSLVIPLVFHKGRWRVVDPSLTLPRRAIAWTGMGHFISGGPAGFQPGNGSWAFIPNGWAFGLNPPLTGFRREYRIVGQYHYAPHASTTASNVKFRLQNASAVLQSVTPLHDPGPPHNSARDIGFAGGWFTSDLYDTHLHNGAYYLEARADWATAVGTYYVRHFEIQVRYVLEGV